MPAMPTPLREDSRLSRFLRVAAASLLALGPVGSLASAQTTFFSVEPNQNKFEATPAPGMVAGDMIETLECGFFAHNVFRVSTAPAPPGIYQHRFSDPFSGFGYSDSIEIQGRGTIDDLALPQSVEILASTTDVDPAVQDGFVAWYGFGKSEELYVDFSGSGGCRYGTPTVSELSTAVITPTRLTPLPGGSLGGRRVYLTVTGQAGAVDTEIQLFDSEFNALYATGSDDPSGALTAQVSTALNDGRYYIAISDHELATHLPPSTFWSEGKSPGAAMDFRGGVLNGSGEFPIDFSLRLFDPATGAFEDVNVTKTEPFEVLWFELDVGSGQASASFCVGDGSQVPCPSCSSDALPGTGTGCQNSTGAGAVLTFFRRPGFGANEPALCLEGVPPNAAALVFVSAGTASPIQIGGGLFCLQPGAYRQPIVSGRLDGMAAELLDFQVFPTSMLGQTVFAQALYRDVGAPCGLNVSSGTSFLLW